MKNLLVEIRSCRICTDFLPLGPNPVLSANNSSKVIVIGQAPGSVVHKTGKPWDDKSGERLREWMGVSSKVFYNEKKVALIPMGFCYPGKGTSGDLPPRPECAPQWHGKLFEQFENPVLILLIGSYAQNYYLDKSLQFNTLTDTVRNFNKFLPKYFVLPHPSPRNNIWLKKNEWFVSEVVPQLKSLVAEALR